MASSTFFIALTSCALFTLSVATLSVPPTVKCVVRDGDTWFSVLFHDEGTILPTDTILIKYKSSSTATTLDTECTDAGDWQKKFFLDADFAAFTGGDEIKKYTSAETTAVQDSPTHDYTRILVKLNPCSTHEEETDSTTNEKKQVYSAELQMGPTSWALPNIYDLKCSFKQSTSDGTLTIASSLGQLVEPDEQDITAQLKLYLVNTDGSLGDELEAQSGELQVELGQTVALQANILGDLGDVETAFKYCKLCHVSDCSGDATKNQDLIVQYKDNTETDDHRQINCPHEDIRENSRFDLKKPDGTIAFAEFHYPAFRYSVSEDTSKLHLKCGLAICKKDANSECRGSCLDDTVSGAGRRRRRSADSSKIGSLESSASLAIRIVTPKTESCSKAGPTRRAVPRATCTNGTRVGSVCRQNCDSGFESASGQRFAARACREKITEKIGAIYFGTSPAWSPETTSCYDIDECLMNPCKVDSICENTVGSYRCW